jgi:DNA-binding NarL/FixJ family response regulator
MSGQVDSEGGTAARQITVFLLDDHEVVRRGVRDMLEAEPDIKVVGEAGTASSALARIPALRPDVAVLDVRLPDGDGVTVCREIRSRMPEVACLMLTSFSDDDALFDAIMAGASGFVLKQIRGTDLVSAVRTVAAGQSMLDPGAWPPRPRFPAKNGYVASTWSVTPRQSFSARLDVERPDGLDHRRARDVAGRVASHAVSHCQHPSPDVGGVLVPCTDETRTRGSTDAR